LSQYLSWKTESGNPPDKTSLSFYNRVMMVVLYEMENWEALDSLLVANPGLQKVRDYRQVVLNLSIVQGRYPQAIELAKVLLSKGYSMDDCLDYSKLEPDYDDPRWEAFEVKISEYEEVARHERGERYKMKCELPHLEIHDPRGELLRFAG